MKIHFFFSVFLRFGRCWTTQTFAKGDASLKSWVESTHKGAEAGDWKISAGKYFASADDKGTCALCLCLVRIRRCSLPLPAHAAALFTFFFFYL